VLTLTDYSLFDALPYGLMALGLVLTFRYLRIVDLTFAASFVLGPAVVAKLMLDGWSFWPSLGLAVVSTSAVTLVTLYLLIILRLDALLSGLIASFIGYALALLFTRGTLSLSGIDSPLRALQSYDLQWVNGVAPLHPSQIILFAVLIFVAKAAISIFLSSEAGVAYRALEDERSSSTLLPSIGLAPDRFVAAGIMVANWLAMGSGILVALRENQVTAQRGFDALISIIAAYLLGIGIFERRTRMWTESHKRGLTSIAHHLQRFSPSTAALLGLLLYFFILQGVSRFDVPASVPKSASRMCAGVGNWVSTVQ
jgi:putative tryptophan/tyrosine transport system permease protein